MTLQHPHRQFRRTASTLLLMVLLPDLHAAEANHGPPNILWIITDDQRPDSLACYNQAVSGKSESELGYVSSPHIDQLAKEGVLFTNAYCNSPACAPSRGSMITGRYPFRSGIYGFEQTHNAVSTFKPVVPEVMRDRGYNTALFGKSGYYIFKWGPGLTWNGVGFWDFEMDYKNDLQKHGLTDYFKETKRGKIEGKPAVLGIEESWTYPDGTVRKYFKGESGEKNTPRKGKKTSPSPPIPEADKAMQAAVEKELEILHHAAGHIIGGQSPSDTPKTLDGWTVSEFKSYLSNSGKTYTTAYGLENQGAPDDKPVFLNLGFHFPHTPVLPTKEFRDAFEGKQYKVPDFSLAELKKLPKQLQVLHDKNRFDNLKPDQKQQAIRDFYAFCAFGDSLVGQAVDAFKEFSKSQNREYLIIYACGDHGWHLGEQGIEAKFGPYDLSNHDAVIVVSSDKKKFPPGTVNKEFIEYVDFAPTIYTAAGIDVNKSEFAHLDGQPIQSIAAGKGIKLDYVLGEMNHVYGPRAYIRSHDFAFSMRTREKNGKPGDKWGHPPGEDIRWALQSPLADVEPALFDLRSDPKEQHNLAADPRYLKLTEFFRNKLGNIVLGDGRLEVDWSQRNKFSISDFAKGADDKKLNIPRDIIPSIN